MSYKALLTITKKRRIVKNILRTNRSGRQLMEHITNRLPVQEGVTSWTSCHKQVFEQVFPVGWPESLKMPLLSFGMSKLIRCVPPLNVVWLVNV